MFSLKRILCCISHNSVFSPGRLYLWKNSSPLEKKCPELIKKVSVGPSHVAAIGQSGNLYTLGEGKFGQLGHNDKRNVENFKIVEYFDRLDIKIKDVSCGQRHTIALADNGSVYTFGYGGKDINFLLRLIINPVGPLGHGNNQSCSKPTKIKALQGHFVERITAGKHFNMIIDKQCNVFNWGIGEYGAFGDGNNKNYSLPKKNQYFEYLTKEEKIQLKKVTSCENFSMALMSDDKLYGWGVNQSGQMGIKAEIGVQMYETVNFAAEVIRQGYQQQKVKNFDISLNTLIFELQNGQVWWSGMKIAYKPQKLPLPENTKCRLFAAGDRSLVVISTDNKIYSKNNFILSKTLPNISTGISQTNANQVFDGHVIGIGGQYQKKYAIVE